MSTNHRKRKHRSAARHQDPHSHSQQYQAESFLSHHDAYLNQQQNSNASSSSSSFQGGNHASTRTRHGGRSVTHGEVLFSSILPNQHLHQLPPDPLQALYIQAHEADVIRGPSARLAAQSLEVVEYHEVPLPPEAEPEAGTGRSTTAKRAAADVVMTPKIGSALIQWGGGSRRLGAGVVSNRSRDGAGSVHAGLVVVKDDDDDYLDAGTASMKTAQAQAPIWVDRYDARLLLDALPTSSGSSLAPAPSSPTGWSDLSSDAEDTFFFDSHETEDFRREKRRRVLEHTREERLRARMQEDGSDAEEGKDQEEELDVWGASDEEPEPPQKDLMARTAAHLLSSPNAAQLEMRILANHGGDRRFAFLRGRWARAWGIAKAKSRVALKEKEKGDKEGKERKKEGGGLGVLALAGYGSDSDSEEGNGDGDREEAEPSASAPVPTPAPAPVVSPALEVNANTQQQQEENSEEAALQEARRKRLKAWAEKRKAAAAQIQSSDGV